jgi:hypothetical protein
LPFTKYNGPDREAITRRGEIIVGLERHTLELNQSHQKSLEDSADALDAVICAFAAIAVVTNRLVPLDDPRVGQEGKIAVHE